MLKRLILGVVATVFFAFQLQIGSAFALNVDPALRTVKANEQGDTVVLTNEQLQLGEREFYNTCSQCHNGGRTKTNPNVTLGTKALANAYPARDNIEGVVDYLKNPTTYDGEEPILEFHPNTQRPDLYPEMRNYTDDDLKAIAGFVLSAQNIKASWGRGKVYD